MIRPPRCLIIGFSTACAQRERRRQVGGEHRVPVLALHPQHQLVAGDAGVVHQDVDPAVPLEHAADQRRRPTRASVTSSATRSAWPPAAAISSPPSPRRCRRAPPRRRARPARPASAAIARPMPRDAPVTIATLSRQVDHAASLSAPSSAASAVRRLPMLDAPCASAIDLLDQPAQHRARAHLNDTCVTPSRRKAAHDVFPAHRRRHLPDQRLDRRAARRASARRRRWRRPGTRGSCDGQRAQLRRQPILGRLHQRAVERRADRQRHRRAWRRAPSRARRRARTAAACAGDHHLPGRVEVGRADDLALGRLLARLRDTSRRRARESPPSRPCRPAPPPACSARAAAPMRTASAKR